MKKTIGALLEGLSKKRAGSRVLLYHRSTWRIEVKERDEMEERIAELVEEANQRQMEIILEFIASLLGPGH